MGKKNIKKHNFFIVSVIILASIGIAIGPLAFSATTATVSATVTAQNVSVTVLSGSVAYGTLSLSGSTSTLASALNDTQNASSTSNVAEDFNIKTSDATGGVTWVATSTAGSDLYVHSFSTNSGSTWAAMASSSYSTLKTNVAALGAQAFDLKLDTPTASSDFAQKSITVTVQAVAH